MCERRGALDRIVAGGKMRGLEVKATENTQNKTKENLSFKTNREPMGWETASDSLVQI